MNPIFPQKLTSGDTIMVCSPSDSLSFMPKSMQTLAESRFQELGMKVVYSDHATEVNEFDTSSIASRVSDLHQAFKDPKVSAIIASYGGYFVHQLLPHLDWDLIQNNPKVLIGFSDISALQNAIFTKTGLITYSGPNFAEMGQKHHFDYTFDCFQQCLMSSEPFLLSPSQSWSDDNWYANQEDRTLTPNPGLFSITPGTAEGKILGGNIGTFRLLQGTPYFPDLTDSILFLEDDYESSLGIFERDLQSLIHLEAFAGVRGIVIGRFQHKSKVTPEQLTTVIKTKPELNTIPVVANADFGHTSPMATFPIGGKARISVSEKQSQLKIIKH